MSMLVVASEDEKALPPPGEDEGVSGVGNEGVKRGEAVGHQSTAVGDGGGDKKLVGIEGGVGEGEESYYPDEQYADCNQETYGGGQQQYNEEYYYEHDYAKEVEEYKVYCEQLNSAIEQRDKYIEQQQYEIEALKAQQQTLKQDVKRSRAGNNAQLEKKVRIFNAKERSWNREKQELQRENNGLAAQLKQLEIEVVNFMRSQGIEEEDYGMEDDDEEEEDYSMTYVDDAPDRDDGVVYGGGGVPPSRARRQQQRAPDDPDATMLLEKPESDQCIICHAQIGACVHTMQVDHRGMEAGSIAHSTPRIQVLDTEDPEEGTAGGRHEEGSGPPTAEEKNGDEGAAGDAVDKPAQGDSASEEEGRSVKEEGKAEEGKHAEPEGKFGDNNSGEEGKKCGDDDNTATDESGSEEDIGVEETEVVPLRLSDIGSSDDGTSDGSDNVDEDQKVQIVGRKITPKKSSPCSTPASSPKVPPPGEPPGGTPPVVATEGPPAQQRVAPPAKPAVNPPASVQPGGGKKSSIVRRGKGKKGQKYAVGAPAPPTGLPKPKKVVLKRIQHLRRVARNRQLAGGKKKGPLV